MGVTLFTISTKLPHLNHYYYNMPSTWPIANARQFLTKVHYLLRVDAATVLNASLAYLM